MEAIFHTDLESEFKNELIDEADEALEIFSIQRSLNMKGCPYDNAVAEAMLKVIKTEFTNGAHFNSLDQLELNEYVNWFSTIRIHGTLGDQSPIEYRVKT